MLPRPQKARRNAARRLPLSCGDYLDVAGRRRSCRCRPSCFGRCFVVLLAPFSVVGSFVRAGESVPFAFSLFCRPLAVGEVLASVSARLSSVGADGAVFSVRRSGSVVRRWRWLPSVGCLPVRG